MIIYRITNLINNKMYIGQTIKSLEHRWKAHIADSRVKSKRPICLAIAKYGKEYFRIEQIAKVDSKEQLDELEELIIRMLDSINPKIGYNARAGGNNTTFSSEVRAKMSLAKKGKPSNKKDTSCSPETAKKIGLANKGKVPWNKGKSQPEAQKQAHSARMKGRPAWNKGLKFNNNNKDK